VNWVDTEQKFKTIKEGIIIIGLVLGGGWAIYRFSEIENSSARVSVERAIADSKNFGLQFDMNLESFYYKKHEKCIVNGNVFVKNISTNFVILDFSKKAPIVVSEFLINQESSDFRYKYLKEIWLEDDGYRRKKNFEISPGRSVNIPFSVVVDNPGIYGFAFKIRPYITGKSEKMRVTYWGTRGITKACI
jgi:hypothetical protein